MQYRSPAEYYFKYLLCHPDGYTAEHIRRIAADQDLIFVGMPYLERLRKRLPVPSPFYPEDRRHVRSQAFLEAERIFSLFHPNNDARGAVSILGMPQVKVTLETLLLTRVQPVYAASLLRQREGVDLTSKTIELYQHFFFNISLVGFEGMKILVRKMSLEASEDPDEREIAAAQLKLHSSDPRQLVSQVATPQIAQALNSLRMGYSPNRLDVGKLTSSARSAAIAMTMDAVLKGRSRDAQNYALTAKLLHEVVNDLGDGESIQSDLTRLMLETETAAVPTLQALPPPIQATTQVIKTHGEPANEPSKH